MAALTIYDMAKSVGRAMTNTEIYLESKNGGKAESTGGKKHSIIKKGEVRLWRLKR